MSLQDLATEITSTLQTLEAAQGAAASLTKQVTDLQAQLQATQDQLAQTQIQITPAWEKIADKIIAGGLSFAKYNVPYAFGGDNQQEGGLDCSGFTKLLFDLHAGTSLPRVSGNQSQSGTAVQQSDARKGDCVFFTYDQRNNGLPTHVGIYMGDGNMLHTNNDKERIHITPVKWDTVTCIRRFIQG